MPGQWLVVFSTWDSSVFFPFFFFLPFLFFLFLFLLLSLPPPHLGASGGLPVCFADLVLAWLLGTIELHFVELYQQQRLVGPGRQLLVEPDMD